MVDFQRSVPYCQEYLLPPGKTAKDMVRLLLARQKTVFHTTVVERGDLPYIALLRNMRSLMNLYTLEEIKRGIELTIWFGDHPASTKFVEEQILWLREIRSFRLPITSE